MTTKEGMKMDKPSETTTEKQPRSEMRVNIQRLELTQLSLAAQSHEEPSLETQHARWRAQITATTGRFAYEMARIRRRAGYLRQR